MTEGVTRYVITHLRGGVRVLVFAQQGRNTYATEEEAQKKLEEYRDDLMQMGTRGLEVRPVECWPNHHDPKTRFFDNE